MNRRIIQGYFKEQRGYSLLEVLTASAILVLIAFILLSMYPHSDTMTASQRHRRLALSLIQQKLENYKNIFYSDLKNKVEGETYTIIEEENNITIDDRGTADTEDDLKGKRITEAKWVKFDDPEGKEKEYKVVNIRVTIKYKEGNRDESSLAETYIARH